MSLHQIVYISGTDHDYSEAELSEMLRVFRKNNEANNITGILLYKKNRFMQLIEGEKEKIEALFQNIMIDSRHQDVLQIFSNPTEQRDFENWSMSFYHLGEVKSLEVPGYSNYMETELDSGIFSSSGEIFRFLRIFKLSIVSF